MSSVSEAISQNEIDNLLSSLNTTSEEQGATPFQFGALPESENTANDDITILNSPPERRNYKLYNFRRPDKFSKDHLRAMETLHDSFSRQLGLLLTGYLRMNIEVDVVSVDQLTYDEFVRSMPSPMIIAILEMEPLSGQALLGFTHEISSSMIDRMLGGPGTCESKPRELTDIEQSLMKRIVDRTINCLEEAWQSVVPVHMSMVGMEDSYNLIQVATSGEIIALVTFEITLNARDSGLLSLCIPFPVLETVLAQLSNQHIFHRQTEDLSQEEKEKILNKINYAKMPVQVLLSGTQLPLRDLLDLSVGDVIKLDRPAASDLLININHCPKFYGRPGKVKQKLAIYVTDSIENEETIEGFGLDG